MKKKVNLLLIFAMMLSHFVANAESVDLNVDGIDSVNSTTDSTTDAIDSTDTSTEEFIAPTDADTNTQQSTDFDPTQQTFTDVKEGNPYFVAIGYLKYANIIQGYEDNKFHPSDNINRAEALKMTTYANGALTQDEIDNEQEPEEMPFSDISPTSWFVKLVATAKEKGIVNGNPDGTFRPFDNVNLVESLKMFFESDPEKNYRSAPFTLVNDTDPDAWFTQYTSYAITKNLVNIYPTNTINISQEMSRGYVAEIIYRTTMSKQGYDFGKATWYGNAVAGNGTASGEIFDPSLLTAAHRTLPLGTIVEVTNLANGKSVQVKINDRGPQGAGRILDLSSGAFSRIASLGAGVIYVEYKVVSTP